MSAKAVKRRTSAKPAAKTKKAAKGTSGKKAAKKRPKSAKAARKREPSAPRKKASKSRPEAVPGSRKKTRPAAKKKKARRGVLGSRELERYRKLLMERERQLSEAYYLSKGNSQADLDDGTEDYIDYAVHSYAKEFLLSLTELDRRQLFLVEEALRRIQVGEYGQCQNCGRDIHPKRLDVAPWARYCVPCQELEERGLLPQPGAAEEDEEEEPEPTPESEGEAEDEDGEDVESDYEGEMEEEDEDEAKGEIEEEGLTVDEGEDDD